MRFDCGPTKAEVWVEAEKEASRLHTPHKWFAWFPVCVWSHDCRWLEYVARYYPDARPYQTVHGNIAVWTGEPKYARIEELDHYIQED